MRRRLHAVLLLGALGLAALQEPPSAQEPEPSEARPLEPGPRWHTRLQPTAKNEVCWVLVAHDADECRTFVELHDAQSKVPETIGATRRAEPL